MNEELKAQLTAQLAGCRELVKAYEKLGMAGNFGRMLIWKDIEQGEKALASGSDPWMQDALGALKNCK